MGEPPTDPAAPEHDLAAFAQRLRRRHVRGAAFAAACRVVLALAIPCLLVAWLVPPWRLPGVLLPAVLATLAAALAAVRAARVADAALLRVGDLDPTDDPRLVAELGDELATWLEVRRTVASPMRSWLARDVRAKLPALAPATVAAVGRRRLGGLLWIVPLVLLLLVAWFLTNLLSPPWPGVLGGDQGRPDAGAGDDGAGAGGRGRGAGGGDQTPPPDPGKPQEPERRDAAPPPPTAKDEPPEPEAPAPLLDLPSQQRFVVPEFVGDGPTRRARMHVAEVEEGAPAAAPRAARAGEAPPVELPSPTPEQFARAAEAALAARHVPAAEQPMVRRFFETLQKAAK